MKDAQRTRRTFFGSFALSTVKIKTHILSLSHGGGDDDETNNPNLSAPYQVLIIVF